MKEQKAFRFFPPDLHLMGRQSDDVQCKCIMDAIPIILDAVSGHGRVTMYE